MLGRGSDYEVTLRLTTIDALFERPTFEPFSESFEPYSYTSGVDFIANEIYADPSRKRIRATIELPADQITSDLEERARAAVRRYCRAQLKETEHNHQALVWTGSRSLALALVLLIGLVGASRLLAGYDNLLIQILKEGLSILGWVALWLPIQSLTYDVWTQRIDRAVYTRVMNMDLTIRAAEPDPQHESAPVQPTSHAATET